MLEIVLQTKSNIFFEQNKFKEVLDICSRRLELSKQNHDLKNRVYIKDIEGDANFQIGLEYKKKKDLEKSVEYIYHALAIYTDNLKLSKKLKNVEIEGHSYGNIANCYAELGDKSKCLMYYKKHINYTEKHNDIQSKGKAYYNLADTYFSNFKDIKKSKKYCKIADEIFNDIGYKQGIDATKNLLEAIAEDNE